MRPYHLTRLRVDFASEWARHRSSTSAQDGLQEESKHTVEEGASSRPVEHVEAARSPPGFWRQLHLQLARAWLAQRRSAAALAGDVAVQTVAGGGLGLLYVDYAFHNLQLVNFMVAIALGMTLSLAAVPTYTSDRAVFLRECHEAGGGGLSTRAYFVAKCIADTPRLLALATVFVVSFYPLAHPRTSLEAYILICCFDAFAASGAGYLASVLFAPKTAQLGALCMALIFALFSGVQPTIRQMPFALKIVNYASHDRYLIQTLYIEEITHMSEAYRMPPSFYADGADSSVLAQLLNYGYLVRDTSVYWDRHRLRKINLATLMAFGLVTRFLAYVLLMFNTAQSLGRRRSSCGAVTWCFACLSCRRKNQPFDQQSRRGDWRFASQPLRQQSPPPPPPPPPLLSAEHQTTEL